MERIQGQDAHATIMWQGHLAHGSAFSGETFVPRDKCTNYFLVGANSLFYTRCKEEKRGKIAIQE